MSLPAGLTGTTVDLSVQSATTGGSTSLTAYTVRPPGSERLPGVVLIHEVFGLDDEARAHARRIADWGYVVAAPDLYADGGTRRCLKGTFQALAAGRGRPFGDIAATRQYLLDRDDTTDGVGIIGFCMGGGFALLSAVPERGFDVSAVNYGQLPSTPDVLTGACPIIANYGAKDRSLPDAARKLDYHLGRLGVEHEVHEYPDASHAFLDREVPGPWWVKPILKVAGFGPEPQSAAEAWPRIEAYFAAHLRR